MSDFVHLHVHSDYSLLDGAAKVQNIIESVKNHGQTAVALTDHGAMYGVVDFYRAATDAGIKPIIGCEVYIAEGKLSEKSAREREYSHLVLLCKNETGYKNLMKLSSIGFLDGFYYKPRIDYETLEQHAEGLICLSACLAGDIPQALLHGDEDKAYDIAKRLKNLFGEDFYIEIQDHSLTDEKIVLPRLVQLAEKLEIPLVATNDTHYINKEDAEAQDILMCIQTVSRQDEGHLTFGTDEFYIKSAEEMKRLFAAHPEALENSVKIAEKCNLELDFKTTYLPEFAVPGGKNHAEYLRELTQAGLEKRYNMSGEMKTTLVERLNYELSTIEEMGFTDYFLIVSDFIGFAKSNKIEVGPGRGSAAGSLVAYCLGITDIDPIRYNLFFERFLNPERISMPDIDIDFCYVRRPEVIEYVTKKYGADHVAQIITFGTMGAKQVVRDVARAMGIPVVEANRIAKMIPFEIKMTLSKALAQNPKLTQEYQNPEMKKWLNMCLKLEGMARHSSTHAAGVIITKSQLTQFVPLSRNAKDNSITTQYVMGNIEALGLLKMDFLGLRTLTVIRDALDMIYKNHGVKIDFDKIEPDDPAVYKMITSGSTDGVFQLESEGMRQLMTQLKPENLGDIMVGISLFRPGPMAKIPDYIKGKNAPKKVVYKHPIIEKILKETYGCMVYQEQVMEMVRDMAGYSLGRSDLVRRAMSKKKADVMAKERDIFINGTDGVPGAIALGVPKAVASEIFDQMTDFAEYAFNKSHACAYAVIAYRTAYLKCHYEREFMTALLNSFMGAPDKMAHYMRYMQKSGIPLYGPDVNKSYAVFACEGDGVRFGLEALKQVGGAIEYSIAERKKGDYADLYDFIERNCGNLNKSQLESLILSGAFDFTGETRSTMIVEYEKLLTAATGAVAQRLSGQSTFFDISDEPAAKPTLVRLPEYGIREKLAFEKEITGLYISGHPLKEYTAAGDIFEKISGVLSAEDDRQAAARLDGTDVDVSGILSGVKVRSTKAKQLMANAVLEDLSGTIGVIVFPKTFQYNESKLKNDAVVTISGRISIPEQGAPEIIAESITPYNPPDPAYIGKKLYIRIHLENSALISKIKNVCAFYPGECLPRIVVSSTGARYELPGEYKVGICSKLIDELKTAVGEENVGII